MGLAAGTSLTDVYISELYDVKETETTTTLSNLEVSVVKEATSLPFMPSWTIQTGSMSGDMLASSAILFSLSYALGSLIVWSPVKTPTENPFLAYSGALGKVGTPSVATVLLWSSSVSISILRVAPGPETEKTQCIQFEFEFLHLLVFSVRLGPDSGMIDLSSPPFTSVLCPTCVAATLLSLWGPGLMTNLAARTMSRL
jgi:hypothetical protein